jgi:DNA-binding XRE family transcriptional regulator
MATKKKAAPAKRAAKKETESRQPVLDLTNGKTGKVHPLLWLVDNKLPKGSNKSDLARHLGCAPQSLYKWERLAKADHNFPLPVPRALQIAKYFRVKPGLFRPDIFGAQ